MENLGVEHPKDPKTGVDIFMTADFVITYNDKEFARTVALKVTNGGADISLQLDTSKVGIFDYSLQNITEWTGIQTYSIKVFPVGSGASGVTADSMDVDVSKLSRH